MILTTEHPLDNPTRRAIWTAKALASGYPLLTGPLFDRMRADFCMHFDGRDSDNEREWSDGYDFK